ncbi:MAG: hypothetical protein ACOC0Q_07245 [Wenzhouxiangella sp.]
MEEIVAAARIQPFGLWPCNQEAVQLALACHWERALGAMGGRVWHGLRATEAQSVMDARSIEQPSRWTLLQQMQAFVGCACRELNEWEAEQAENRRSK